MPNPEGILKDASFEKKWTQVRLIGKAEYDRATAAKADESSIEIVRRLLRDTIVSHLTYEGYFAEGLTLEYESPKWATDKVTVTADFLRNGKTVKAVFEVPVNVVTCPYVGWPSLLTRDLP